MAREIWNEEETPTQGASRGHRSQFLPAGGTFVQRRFPPPNLTRSTLTRSSQMIIQQFLLPLTIKMMNERKNQKTKR